MADIYVTKINADGAAPEWLMFERGQYSRPVCILSDHEMRRAIREYAKTDLRTVREIVAEARVRRRAKP